MREFNQPPKGDPPRNTLLISPYCWLLVSELSGIVTFGEVG